jgi:hypothetical protein
MPVVNDPSVNDPLCRRGGPLDFSVSSPYRPWSRTACTSPVPAGAVLGREEPSGEVGPSRTYCTCNRTPIRTAISVLIHEFNYGNGRDPFQQPDGGGWSESLSERSPPRSLSESGTVTGWLRIQSTGRAAKNHRNINTGTRKQPASRGGPRRPLH